MKYSLILRFQKNFQQGGVFKILLSSDGLNNKQDSCLTYADVCCDHLWKQHTKHNRKEKLAVIVWLWVVIKFLFSLQSSRASHQLFSVSVTVGVLDSHGACLSRPRRWTVITDNLILMGFVVAWLSEGKRKASWCFLEESWAGLWFWSVGFLLCYHKGKALQANSGACGNWKENLEELSGTASVSWERYSEVELSFCSGFSERVEKMPNIACKQMEGKGLFFKNYVDYCISMHQKNPVRKTQLTKLMVLVQSV